MNHSSTNVISNMIWRFADKWLEQIIKLTVTLILARLLAPEAYGVVSLITVITAFLQVFVDSGFSNALIQKKDADQLDFSTVFWFSVGVSVFLYILMFIFAPAIARFYEKDFIVPHIRVMSLTMVFGAVNGVQHVIVSKRLIFKKLFFSSLLGTILSGIVSIYMAYRGLGPWALVAMTLTNQVIDGLFLWILIRWRPSFRFSFKRLGPLFRYGSRLLGSSLLSTFSAKISSLLVGKFYTSADLAYYDKGDRITSSIVTNLGSSVQSVLFPVMADVQDDIQKVKALLKKSVKVSAYCMFPLMVGLGVCAKPVVLLLYTEKWSRLIPYVQLYCVSYAFYLIHTANLQVIHALGRSDIFLRLDIIKQVLGLIIMAAALPFGVLPMLAAACAFDMVCIFINSHPNKKLVGYGFLDQIRDILPIIILNIIMGTAVFFVGRIPMPMVLQLIVQIITGVTVYLVGTVVMKIETASYIFKTVRDLIKRKTVKEK